VLGPVAPALLPPLRRDRQVGTRLGDARDALLRALRNRLCERVRTCTSTLLEEAEVVPAGTTAGNLECVALHPGARVQRLAVREPRPARDEVVRLLLHHRKLRPLVLWRVPRQHHAPNALVVVSVADDGDALAAGVLKLGEEVDLLDRLSELLLVPGDFVEELGI